MGRMFYRQENPWKKRLLIIVVSALSLWGVYKYYPLLKSDNLQKIVENSELNNRSFSTRVQEITSQRGGIKAYLFEEHSNPIVAMNFRFERAGTAYDPIGKLGAVNLAAAMMTEGTKDLTSQELKEKLEDNGIHISFRVDKDALFGTLVTTSENSALAFDLLREILINPRLDTEDLQRKKAQTLMLLKQQLEKPQSVMGLAFSKELYGRHPYGRNPLGEVADIGALSAQNLREILKQRLSKDNLIVGLAGDLTAKEAESALERVFGELPEKNVLKKLSAPAVHFDGRVKNVERNDSSQNLAALANLGVSRNNPDFYPLYIANYVFGGAGLNSKLSQSIREDKGLTYSISTQLSQPDLSPLIMGYYSTTPDNTSKIVALWQDQLADFSQKGISAKELEDAKKYLTASYNLRFADIDGIAEIMTGMQKYKLGRDFLQKRNEYVQNVQLDDVNRVIKEYFNNNFVIVNVGNFE